MMRAITLCVILLIAGLGLVPATAQDDAAPVRKPIRHVRTAAIQPPTLPARPRGTAAPLSQPQAQQNPAEVLQKFALADLQAALADASAQNPPDTIAANCYQELIAVVQSPAINPLPAGPGAFQLFQKARDLKNLVSALQSNNGPLTQLNVACAPLVIDVQTTLIRLGIIGGAIAGGLPPP